MDFDRFVTPLYRANPKYPSRALKTSTEGWAILEFTVDESGFTKDVMIIDSSRKVFERVSIDAASKYRYAPSVKDGQLIPTEGVRVRIEYQLSH